MQDLVAMIEDTDNNLIARITAAAQLKALADIAYRKLCRDNRADRGTEKLIEDYIANGGEIKRFDPSETGLEKAKPVYFPSKKRKTMFDNAVERIKVRAAKQEKVRFGF